MDYSVPRFPATAAAKSLQSCPTLCDPIDSSPPGSPVPGILQARILEWVAISFSNAWKWKVKVKSLSRVLLLAIPWTAAYQAPPSMGFSRQEYWNGVPLPYPILYVSLVERGAERDLMWVSVLIIKDGKPVWCTEIMFQTGKGSSGQAIQTLPKSLFCVWKHWKAFAGLTLKSDLNLGRCLWL